MCTGQYSVQKPQVVLGNQGMFIGNVGGRVGVKLVDQEIPVSFQTAGLEDQWLRPVLGTHKITAMYLSTYLACCIFYALVPRRVKLEKA